MWDGRDGASEGALAIRLEATSDFESTSLAFFRAELRPWGKAFPLDEATLAMRPFPALDEMWTVWMMASRARGEPLPAEWEAMCHYAGDVRAGLWPDRVDPEVAIQSLYLALAQHFLAKPVPDRRRFVDEALGFCRHVGARLAAGARLLDDDLFRGEAAFERYVSLLAADRSLYREDLSRARRYVARLPGGAPGDDRRLPLLVLSGPRATQFKLWARRDPSAPGGDGYPLLLVDAPGEPIVLSADPTHKVQLGWLAARLDAREAARGEAARWYDGSRHGGTLVAAPKTGSKLALADVIACLEQELRLRRARSARRWPVAAGAGAAVAAAAAVAVIALAGSRGRGRAGGPSLESQAAPAAKGDPIPKDKVFSLVDAPDGPRSLTHYALIVGVCGYGPPHTLYQSCRDARAVRDELVKDYGYLPRNITFMVDRPEPGDASFGIPTAENLQKALESFVARYGRDPNSTFLFYYSGHGGYEKVGGQQDFGLLEPAGFFDRPDVPLRDRGWQMERIIHDINEEIPSRHLMLLMDNCYSGWAAGARGAQTLTADVYSLWKQKAQVALTAAQRGEQAWEDDPNPDAWRWNGHGAFTAFVLQALHLGATGHPEGDTNGDGVITDEELAAYVIQHVPPSVASAKSGEVQVPRFFRFDEHELEHGQFLFVPGAAR